MEELTEILEAELAVSTVPNDPVRKHPRFALYKARTKIPDQEERRRRLLEEQKKKRSELYNASRNLISILEDAVENKEKDWYSRSKVINIHRKLCKDQLMFSEWLVEVPEDLEVWYMVPSPEGQRTIVVAYRMKTVAFTKAGYNRATFQSLLPGGGYESGKGCTILDCIWSVKDNTYYVLDVLYWSNQPVMNCETEFRFFWLETKLQEMPEIGTSGKENNYIFKSLPYYKCTKEVMTEVMANENMFTNEGPRLDGLLFYHPKTHYTPGHTPLVGWLKPYMMPEMLGVQVASVYMQESMDCKPGKTSKKNKRNKKTELEEAMETSNDVESKAADPDMIVMTPSPVNKTVSIPDPKQMLVGDYVIVQNEGKLFPGRVAAMDEHDARVSVMQRSGCLWKWPDEIDYE